MSAERPLIVIATPCFGGLVHQAYMESVLALVQHSAAGSYDLTLALLGSDALITRSRNTLVAAFLATKPATHLLFIDADIRFEPEQVDRMLALDEDVVAGMYPLKRLDWDLVAASNATSPDALQTDALHYVGLPCTGAEREERGAFVTGVYAGTGFLLIRRNVIERMVDAHPELRYSNVHAFPKPTLGVDQQYALFDCMIEPETGNYLSEDYAFCRRWRDLGGRIWLDREGRLTHVGAYNYRGNPATKMALHQPMPRIAAVG